MQRFYNNRMLQIFIAVRHRITDHRRWNNPQEYLVVGLDISKAFNTLSPVAIPYEVSSLRPLALQMENSKAGVAWCVNALSSLKQSVLHVQINTGIPQGSTLSPIIFPRE